MRILTIKKLFVFVIMISCWNIAFSQIRFEPAYFITNSDQKVNCLIKNADWHYNPASFDYKIDENDVPAHANIDSIKEFRVQGYAKYVRADVNIERSPDFGSDINELSSSRTPDFQKEKLFLKVIVEGPANLYVYEQAKYVRFFYSTDSKPIEPLIYKAFRTDDANFQENKTYISQLQQDVACANSSADYVGYHERELVKYFSAYNQCKGFSKKEEMTKRAERKKFFFSVIGGLNYSSLHTENLLAAQYFKA